MRLRRRRSVYERHQRYEFLGFAAVAERANVRVAGNAEIAVHGVGRVKEQGGAARAPSAWRRFSGQSAGSYDAGDHDLPP